MIAISIASGFALSIILGGTIFMIIQLLAAFVGSVGFAMLLNMREKQVAYAGIGGNH